MKTTNLILLLSFVLMGVTSFSQSSINHHEYFNTSTPNEYFLSRGSTITNDLKSVLICGSVSELLNNQRELDYGHDAFLLKTKLDGTNIYNKRFGINQSSALGFDQVYEHSNGYVYCAAVAGNRQVYGLLKLDAATGSSIIAQNLFFDISGSPGRDFHFSKILNHGNHLYLIGYAKYTYGPFNNPVHKTFVMKYDHNVNLIDYRVYTITSPSSPLSTSDEETVASDALIHTNTVTLNDEIVITGEGQNLINTKGSAYNHDALFLLRIDLATLNPIDLNFYPQVVSMSPFAVEGSYAASICELGADKFMIGGFFELFLQHFGLSIIELDESGAYLSNNSMYLPNLPNSFTPDPFLNRPTTIHADYIDREVVVSIFGDIQFNGFYSSLKNHNKYAWENRSFLLNYNYSQSRVISLKNLTPISHGSDSNYATNMLYLGIDNYILIGNNLATAYSPSSTSTLKGTTYFANDINSDMATCMKRLERSDSYDVNYTRLATTLQAWRPFRTTPNFQINISDNNDKKICTESIVDRDRSVIQKNGYTIKIRNLSTTAAVTSYSLNLSSDEYIKYSAWDIPSEILYILNENTLYVLELVNNTTNEKRIVKFSK